MLASTLRRCAYAHLLDPGGVDRSIHRLSLLGAEVPGLGDHVLGHSLVQAPVGQLRIRLWQVEPQRSRHP
jgi:hypothetical protein